MIPQNLNYKKNNELKVAAITNKKEMNEMLENNYDEIVEDTTNVNEPEDTSPRVDAITPTKRKIALPRKISEIKQYEPVTNCMTNQTEQTESEMLDENLDEDLEIATDYGEQQDKPTVETPSEIPARTALNPAIQRRMPPHKPASQRSAIPARSVQTDNQTKLDTAMQKEEEAAGQEVVKFSSDRFQKPKSVSVSRSSSRTGAWISLVNAKNGNKRMNLGNKLMTQLNDPMQVQIKYSDCEIALCEFFSDEDINFSIRSGSKGNQNIIYNAGLIDEITEWFDLDFTGISSISFFDENVTVDNSQDKPVVIIRVN